MLQFIAHVVVLVALYFVSPVQLLSMHHFFSLSDLYGNSLWRFTLRKWSCEVLSSHVCLLCSAPCHGKEGKGVAVSRCKLMVPFTLQKNMKKWKRQDFI